MVRRTCFRADSVVFPCPELTRAARVSPPAKRPKDDWGPPGTRIAAPLSRNGPQPNETGYDYETLHAQPTWSRWLPGWRRAQGERRQDRSDQTTDFPGRDGKVHRRCDSFRPV